MTKDIKLVALDMDGTLLNDDMEVSEENARVIEEAINKGVHVVLATGRPMAMVESFSKDLNLPSYLVTVNGGEIWTVDLELLEQHYLDAKYIEMMWNFTEEIGGFYVWIVSSEEIYINELPENPSEESWLKFGCKTDNLDNLNDLKEKIARHKDHLEITNSLPNNIEVNPIGVNKLAALEKVCEKLGFTMANVMAVGDSLNDQKMIEGAGIGVAMGNAQKVIKEIADVTVETNNEHGVARAIERFVLNKK